MIKLLASGQSNALGRDTRSHPPLSRRVMVWDNVNDTDSLAELGTAFRVPEAAHPPFSRGAMSPLVFAASVLADRLDDDVSLVLVAKGATRIEQWLGADGTPGPMFRRIVAVSRRANTGSFDALLWHQGEADDQLVAGYASKFQRLVEALRSDEILGANAPILVGETAAKWTEVNAVLHVLPKLHPTIRFVGLADLPTYDGVHFSAVTLPEIGKRYADAFLLAEAASHL